MKFTVVFPSGESTDLSYGLVFIPCPVWVQGSREVINLNPAIPYYQPGSVRRLMEKEGITPDPNNRAVSVIIHSAGNGSRADMDVLLADLKEEGFWVSVYG